MVTSAEPSSASSPPTSDPLPPPPSSTPHAHDHDLLSFPILKPRSKRRPAAKLPPPPPLPSPDKPSQLGDDRPWNLRSCRSPASWRTYRRPRFSVPLSTDEIEEDIYAVTGSRPRRRPRKRPRVVQKQVDLVFPGLWLTEVTVELYRVPDDR